jgi:hypothetical protein
VVSGRSSVKWQNLKNKVAGFFGNLNDRLNAFLLHLSQPLNLFRFLAILLVIDFVAFMSLTRGSYLQLLNPLAFLSVPESDGRDLVELYFPRSLSLTGIEAIYHEGEQAPIVPGLRAGEKLLTEAAVTEEIILIKKRVAAPVAGNGRPLSPNEATARRIILELMAGPAGELETLKARNLLKEPLLLRGLWTYQGKLYISTEKSIWDRMAPNERRITEYCLTESLKKNLPGVAFTLLKEQ